MPWELGYFDGKHPNQIGILPLVENSGDRFYGQEYLGLYPDYERIHMEIGGLQFAHDINETKAMTLVKAARR